MEPIKRLMSYSEYTREKHAAIFRMYLELLKKEREENALRAEHIGKIYYARVIADSQHPAMDPCYVMRIINKELRNDGQI